MKKSIISFIHGFDIKKDRDGVGSYAEKLISELKNALPENLWTMRIITHRDAGLVNFSNMLFNVFKSSDIVHMQYPYEAWGNQPWPGVLPGLFNLFFRRSRLIMTLHEYSSLHPLRKVSILPNLLFSDVIIFSSIQEEKHFIQSRIYAIRRNIVTQYIPIGVNVSIPNINDIEIQIKRDELLSQFPLAEKKILGYFGFIYDAKQPYKMLDIIELSKDTENPFCLIIAGDFPENHDNTRAKFMKHIQQKNISDQVLLLGYVSDDKQLATILSACDATLALYSDGVTSRRGSFWYLVKLGVKIITTSPDTIEEFASYPDFNLLTEQQIYYVDRYAAAGKILSDLKNLKTYAIPRRNDKITKGWSEIAQLNFKVYQQLLISRKGEGKKI